MLLLHDEGAPQALRLLRAAAGLLSPQVSVLPQGHAEFVAPIAQAGAGAAVFASALSIANSGVAVVDTGTLPKKALKQLAEALPAQARACALARVAAGCTQRSAPPRTPAAHACNPPPCAPRAQSLPAPGVPDVAVPQTATVWAACAQEDLAPGDPGVGAALAGGKRWARPAVGGGGFDFALHDASDEGAAALWARCGPNSLLSVPQRTDGSS